MRAAVDANYKEDLRELNDRNFLLFDAKLEQRLVELHAKLEIRIDGVATELNARIDRVSVEFNAKLDTRLAELKAELITWMFLFWIGTVVTIVGAIRVMR